MTLVLLRDVYRYECSENKCADYTCLRRAEALGCDAFCRFDANGDGVISQEENELPFLLCTDGDRGWWQSTWLLSIPRIIYSANFLVNVSFVSFAIVYEHTLNSNVVQIHLASAVPYSHDFCMRVRPPSSFQFSSSFLFPFPCLPFHLPPSLPFLSLTLPQTQLGDLGAFRCKLAANVL